MAPICSTSRGAPCDLPCGPLGGGFGCAIPGNANNRIAAGRFDSDSRMDLALLVPSTAGSSFAQGAYWLRSMSDGGFSATFIGATAAGFGKIVTVGPDAGRDSVAAVVVVTPRLSYGWSPCLPDGGFDGGMHQLFTMVGPVDDIAPARLPGWTQDGLVAVTKGTGMGSVTTYPRFSSGDATGFQSQGTGTKEWEAVTRMRNFLAISSSSGTQGVAMADGGITAESSAAASGVWKSAQEVNVDGDTTTELFIAEPSGVSIMPYAAGGPPTTPGSAQPVKVDGGAITSFYGWAIGTLGPPSIGVTLVTLPDAGGVRQLGAFNLVGSTWEVTEVPRPDIKDAGYAYSQAVFADVNGDGNNDLVLVERNTGNLRIFIQ